MYSKDTASKLAFSADVLKALQQHLLLPGLFRTGFKLSLEHVAETIDKWLRVQV